MKLRFDRILILVLWFVLLWVWNQAFSNSNILSIGSWNTISWRYFCPIDLKINAIYWGLIWFSNCQYAIKFNPSIENLVYVSRWSAFSFTDYKWLSGNLFLVEEKNEEILNGNAVCSILRLTSKTTNMTSTYLEIVDKNWDAPTNLTFAWTDDKLNLSYDWMDTLVWVRNLNINYEACPCTLDKKAPIIDPKSHQFSNSAARYTWVQNITFFVYDKWESSRAYRFGWNAPILANYTWNAPVWMDIQEWVNSWTIKIVFSWWGNFFEYTLNSGLIVNDYTGNLPNIPKFTWDSNIRWYMVSFQTPDLWVEQPVSISVVANDNKLNMWGQCVTDSHKSAWSGMINLKTLPTISLKEPLNDAENVMPSTNLTVRVADDWAWIDITSVQITIPTIYSGSQILMTWYTYSWDELLFSNCTWSPEIWWSYSCDVTIDPYWDLPVSSQIIVTWYVQDLAWSIRTGEWSFHTRPDCSYFWCTNFVDIYLWNELSFFWFSWSLIVFTGTRLPYPYLTWDDNNLVICGPTIEYPILTWSVNIYSGDDVVNWSQYMSSWLYVTGLDFYYDSDNGVITPKY